MSLNNPVLHYKGHHLFVPLQVYGNNKILVPQYKPKPLTCFNCFFSSQRVPDQTENKHTKTTTKPRFEVLVNSEYKCLPIGLSQRVLLLFNDPWCWPMPLVTRSLYINGSPQLALDSAWLRHLCLSLLSHDT